MTTHMEQGNIDAINREFEERDARARASALGIDYIDIAHFPINPDVLRLIEPEESKEAGGIPFFKKGKRIQVASIDPSKEAFRTLIQKLKDMNLEPVVSLCSRIGFQTAFAFYGSELMDRKTVEEVVGYDESEQHTLEKTRESFSDLEQRLPQMHVNTALSEIKITAMKARASDMHFDPRKDGGIDLRFRIDGLLHTILMLQPDQAKRIRVQIKYESGMRSNVTDVPQDGHSAFVVNEREVDLRVSTLPTPYGESIVIRILDSNRGIKKFSELGFSSHIEMNIMESLKHKNGLVLVTGPTGSGKTTTLYSMLAELNEPEVKLVTLEDPIEYHLDGIAQSQVDEKGNYTFESGLKAILRHDPDVILVGEIRVEATAKLATEAALTGHMVLTSLHTNSAISALTRMRNLGIANYNLAPTVKAIFAQRLVRKVCPHCRRMVEVPDDPRVKAAIGRLEAVFASSDLPQQVPEAVGCDRCSQTGYDGRIALCEAIVVDEAMTRMILDGMSEIDILASIKEKTSFLDMYEDGVMKVLQGVTTFSEVSRVIY